MLAHGHPHARQYPLSMLLDEFMLCKEHLDHQASSDATLIQLAISSVLSTEGGKLFKKVLDALAYETVGREQDTGQ